MLEFLEAIDWTLAFYSLVAFVSLGGLLVGMILLARAKLVSTAPCKLYINEDDKLTKTVAGGSTLLSALVESGVPVPSPCGGKATCKQCKVRVVEGGGEVLDVDKASFSRKQIELGWRLSCQCKVKQDMKLILDSHLLSVRSFDAKVISNENVATFIKELIVEMPETIEYRSGSYMQFHVPKFSTHTGDWKKTMDPKYFEDWENFSLFDTKIDFSNKNEEIIRAYSMASYPAEGRKMMFNIRIASPPFVGNKPDANIPWGICSSYAFSLRAGDTIKLSGPYGESFMINDDKELVFLIGGAGSSFGRSHIMHLFRSEKTKRKVTLWYGARSLKENIYQKEYEELAKEFNNFSYNLVLSNPLPEDLEKGWPVNDPIKTNFAFKAFELGQLSKMQEPENALFYVCGPPLHNKSVMKLLDDYGVARSSIILDDFGS